MLFESMRLWVRPIKKDSLTLWFAFRDARTPLWLKLLVILLAVYAFSPIDLIPDFIPVLGLLDDAIIVPLGIILLLRLLPREVRLSCEAQVEQQRQQGKRLFGRAGLLTVLLIWLAIVFWCIHHFMA